MSHPGYGKVAFSETFGDYGPGPRLQETFEDYGRSSLERNSSKLLYISFLSVTFENLTVEFYVLYIINMHIKFRSNQMLFTIRSINLFFIYNFKSQKLEILTFV